MRGATAKSTGAGRLATIPWYNHLRSTTGVLPTWSAQYAAIEGGRYMAGGVSKTFAESHVFTRASVANAFNAEGVLTEHAIDVARFDHNPATDARLGLLTEEERTNIWPQSRNFSNWTQVFTAAVTSAIGIDGTSKSIEVTDSSNSVTQVRQLNIAALAVDDVQYTVTAYFPVTTGTPTHFPQFRFFFIGGSDDRIALAVLNTETGTFVVGVGGESNHDEITTTRVGDWWRLSIVLTNNATGNTSMNIQYWPAWNTNGTVTGEVSATGSTICDFVQVEVSDFATSPIETTGSAVTRKVDLITAVADGGNPFPGYVTGTGTLFVEFESLTENGSGTDQLAVSLDDGTSDNRIQMGIGANGKFNHGSRGQANTNWFLTETQKGNLKGAFAWAANDAAVAVNGVVEHTAGAFTVPIVTRLVVGRDRNNASFLSGHIKQLYYYPSRLSNAEIVALTA